MGVNSLLDFNDFMKVVKKAAVDAVVASKPADMVFGKVISENPLKIKVDQKLILTEAQLVLSRNVTDHDINIEIYDGEKDDPCITINNETWNTELLSHSCEVDLTHRHEIKGVKRIRMLKKLKVDEEVILMQIAGGQKYIVIDRTGKV